MNKRGFAITCLEVAFWCTMGTILAQAQSREKHFVPFNDFLDNTRAADSIELTRSGSRVKDAAAFEEMRQHIVTMYRDVEVTHSFVSGSNHFDCIPVDQQPTVKALGLKTIAPTPPDSLLTKPSGADDEPRFRASPATQLSAEKETDEFGNRIGCELNAIPMRRITLEDMTHFRTLREFFQKGPGQAGRPRSSEPKDISAEVDGAAHKYSIVFQQVDNLGGNSNLNLWSPYVNTSWGEGFSLSQAWYVGGNGASEQTAEVGWQNYPDMYGSENSRLFIYWTADGYNTTGCYNLDCPAFVQVTNSSFLGGAFTHYSTYDGPQYEFSARYYLYRGNWWLAIQGRWIGYYPGQIYRGGQLAYYAQFMEFGTEGTGTTLWPPEGSGEWAASGWEIAAYQRHLFYNTLSGTAVWDSLTAFQPSPGCYNVLGPFFGNFSGWGTYFFEGGPGGAGC
jgi:hypothetical protein